MAGLSLAGLRYNAFIQDWVAPLDDRAGDDPFAALLRAEAADWIEVGRRIEYFEGPPYKPRGVPMAQLQLLDRDAASGWPVGAAAHRSFEQALWDSIAELHEARSEFLQAVVFASRDEWIERIDAIRLLADQVSDGARLSPLDVEAISWALSGAAPTDASDWWPVGSDPDWSGPHPAAWRTGGCRPLRTHHGERVAELDHVRQMLLRALSRADDAFAEALVEARSEAAVDGSERAVVASPAPARRAPALSGISRRPAPEHRRRKVSPRTRAYGLVVLALVSAIVGLVIALAARYGEATAALAAVVGVLAPLLWLNRRTRRTELDERDEDFDRWR